MSENNQARRAVVNIDPAQIVSRDRLRKLRSDKVDALADSIKARGQLQPIIVQRHGADFILIVGRHRLQAVRKLGHDTIRAEIADGLDPDQALLIEIDENLVRADLSPAERALHISKRKELYEKAHPGTTHGGDRRSVGSSSQNENLKAFVADTAVKTGKGRSTVARDVTRANKVSVLDEIVGTSLDKGSEIDELAKLSEANQHELADRAKAGEKVSAKPAKAKPVGAASTVSTASLTANPAATDGATPTASLAANPVPATVAAPAPAAETPASSRDVGPYSGAEHDRLRARNDALNGENRALQIRISGLENEIAELKERNAGLEARIAELVEKSPTPDGAASGVAPTTDASGADLDVRDFAGGSLRR